MRICCQNQAKLELVLVAMSNSDEPKSNKLKEVYRERTVEDQREIYRDWAETYDQQTTGEFGWIGFNTAAAEFSTRVHDKQSRILDAGCGTGLSGKALHDLGYSNLHGRDLSPEMLAKASTRRVYQTLSEIDLTQPIEEEPFDAVISVGVFGFGPPEPEHIRHLVDVTRRGGLVILTVNGKGWKDRNWDKVLPAVVSEYQLNLSETLDIDYLEKEEIPGKLLIFKA